MKKILVTALAAISCFSCLAACGDEKADETNLAGAISKLETLYGDKDVKTRADYELDNSVTVDGVTYALSWSVDVTTGVTLTNASGKTTVDLAEDLTADLAYVLTGTVTAPNGSSKTVTFNRTVAKVPQTFSAAPQAGDTFTLYAYANNADVFFDGGLQENTNLTLSTNASKAVTVTAEAVADKENVFYLTFTDPVKSTKQYLGVQNLMVSGSWLMGLYYSSNKKSYANSSASFEWTFDVEKGIMVSTMEQITLGVVGSTDTFKNVSFCMQYADGYFTAVNVAETTESTSLVKLAK